MFIGGVASRDSMVWMITMILDGVGATTFCFCLKMHRSLSSSYLLLCFF